MQRYLAPEVLTAEASANPHFEIHKAGDVYAFGLLAWECGRRVTLDKIDGEPQLPPNGMPSEKFVFFLHFTSMLESH